MTNSLKCLIYCKVYFQCFLKCIIDSNGISNGDSINNGPLLEILNNNLPSKLKPIWMRPLHNAIFTCLDKCMNICLPRTS